VYVVVMQTDVRDAGQQFGPFSKREEAEACVIALASRQDVRSATIQEVK
jgi:hypothetical protein